MPRTEELPTEGVASAGRFDRGFAIQRPTRTPKQGAAAVAAAMAMEHAAATDNQAFADYAGELVEESSGAGVPVPVTTAFDNEDAEAYGVNVDTGPPPSLTAPLPRRQPNREPEPVAEEDEGVYEPDSSTSEVEEGEPVAQLPAHILEALTDEDEDEDDEWEDEDEGYQAPDFEADLQAVAPVSIYEELGYTEFEVESDPRLQRIVAQVAKERKRAEFERAQKTKAQGKARLTEAAEHFTYLDKASLREISRRSPSNREFWRNVKAENDRVGKLVERHVAGERQRTQAAEEQLSVAERQRARDQWQGEPAPTETSAADYEYQRKLAQSRDRRGLAGIIGERRRRGQIRL